MAIILFNDNEFKELIIDALMYLQQHECSLNDTRKPPCREMCEEYFAIMNKGRIFIIQKTITLPVLLHII